MVAHTILLVMILGVVLVILLITGLLYLQIKECDEKYNVLVKHYYEPCHSVKEKIASEKENTSEEEKEYTPQRTPFDILDDMLEGKVDINNETK